MQTVSDSVDFTTSAADIDLGLGSMAATRVSGPPQRKTRKVERAAVLQSWALLSTMQTTNKTHVCVT